MDIAKGEKPKGKKSGGKDEKKPGGEVPVEPVLDGNGFGAVEPLDFGGESGDDSFPMDFEMPDFASMGMVIKFMSWIPAVVSAMVVFLLSFIAHAMMVGLDFREPFPWLSQYNMTFGYFMFMILLSLFLAVIVGVLVKYTGGRKAGSQLP